MYKYGIHLTSGLVNASLAGLAIPGKSAPCATISIERQSDRSHQAAKQLAEVGVKVGGYRLEPAVAGKPVRRLGRSPVRKRQQE